MNWERAIIFLDGIIDKLRRRSNKVSEFWLKAIGKRLRKLKGLDPSDAAGIAAIRNDTKLLSDLMDVMQRAGENLVQDAKALLKMAARLSSDAAPVAQDLAMDEWISGVAEAAQGQLANIAHTSAVVVVSSSGVVSPGEAYVRAVDEVAAQLASGEDGLKRATEKVCEEFADAGLSVVEYESGRVEELGAATERNLKQAVHEVYQGVQRRVGQEYGADGVEISAHADCAPDHLEIQGRQFTNEEYEKVNGALRRKIGTWNCRHVVYSIIVGITPPTYTDEELEAMKAKAKAVQEFDGKQMTVYEATQIQRRLEREIRKQKNRAIIAKAAGEDDMRRIAQTRINYLTDKYKDLSDTFNIPTKMERTRVEGFHWVKEKKLLPKAEHLLLSKTTPDNDIIIAGANAIKDALLHGKTSDEICKAIIDNHWSLKLFTPAEMKSWLEENGFEVKPLNKGNFKNKPFEKGGGYRIHFGGDGYFQYHPEKRSHHKEAYWRVSNGKYRDNRYNMEGNQIFE